MLLSHYEGQINDEEFMLLYDVSGSKNLSLPFWKHDRFSMEHMENHEYISEIRFEKQYLFLLHGILHITD